MTTGFRQVPETRARFVGVSSRRWTHAVFVPCDLEGADMWTYDAVERPNRTALVRLCPRWVGRAECGQVVRGIVAGPNGGHDWERVSSNDRCPRCERAIERSRHDDR